MTYRFTKEWCLKQAQKEEKYNGIIAAGKAAIPNQLDHPPFSDDNITELKAHIPFGKFINLQRRSKNWSMEELAQKADVDLKDILEIEENIFHTPDLRTIYQFSELFNLEQKKLMQLSGLSQAKDNSFQEETVRFAAHSQSIDALTSQEQDALADLVKILSN